MFKADDRSANFHFTSNLESKCFNPQVNPSFTKFPKPNVSNALRFSSVYPHYRRNKIPPSALQLHLLSRLAESQSLPKLVTTHLLCPLCLHAWRYVNSFPGIRQICTVIIDTGDIFYIGPLGRLIRPASVADECSIANRLQSTFLRSKVRDNHVLCSLIQLENGIRGDPRKEQLHYQPFLRLRSSLSWVLSFKRCKWLRLPFNYHFSGMYKIKVPQRTLLLS